MAMAPSRRPGNALTSTSRCRRVSSCWRRAWRLRAGGSGGCPGQRGVTPCRYVPGVHEQPFAPVVDSEQVFVVQWTKSEQVFG